MELEPVEIQAANYLASFLKFLLNLSCINVLFFQNRKHFLVEICQKG